MNPRNHKAWPPKSGIEEVFNAMTWIKSGTVPEDETLIGLWNLDRIAFQGPVPSIGIKSEITDKDEMFYFLLGHPDNISSEEYARESIETLAGAKACMTDWEPNKTLLPPGLSNFDNTMYF
jgi:hypothetical protein